MHGLLSPFSLDGPEVKFTAPGNNILTWFLKNRVETTVEVNGTSPATAFAAGLVGLGYSRYGTYFKPSSRLWEMGTPVFSPIESFSGVHDILGQQDAFFGYGLLDSTRMLYQNKDVNGDGKVDISDLSIVGNSFGSSIGSPSYVPAADLNADGQINIVDLVLVAGKFGTVFSAPPSKDVWGSNLNYNPVVDFHSPQGSLFYGIMGECTTQCTGETVNLGGTVNPNIASYVSSNTNLTAYLRVTYSSGTVVNTPNVITFHASAPGQTSSTPFQVPTGAFWQIFWYIQGSQLNSFNVQVFADISLSNSVSSEGWGLLMYST